MRKTKKPVNLCQDLLLLELWKEEAKARVAYEGARSAARRREAELAVESLKTAGLEVPEGLDTSHRCWECPDLRNRIGLCVYDSRDPDGEWCLFCGEPLDRG